MLGAAQHDKNVGLNPSRSFLSSSDAPWPHQDSSVQNEEAVGLEPYILYDPSPFMSSLTKTPKRSKKTRRLGPVRVSRPDQYEGFDVNSKLECICTLIPLGLMHIQALSEEEVCTLAGEWYARKSTMLPGRRYGSNPGRVQLAGKRHPLCIPRVQCVAGGEIPLQTLGYLRGTGRLNEVLLKRVLYGISGWNYEVAAAAVVPVALGLSSSTVSRACTQGSAKQWMR